MMMDAAIRIVWGYEGCGRNMAEPRLVRTAWRHLDCCQATHQSKGFLDMTLRVVFFGVHWWFFCANWVTGQGFTSFEMGEGVHFNACKGELIRIKGMEYELKHVW